VVTSVVTIRERKEDPEIPAGGVIEATLAPDRSKSRRRHQVPTQSLGTVPLDPRAADVSAVPDRRQREREQ